jgi:hypothetical protein
MILGDSLNVMASLADRERLPGRHTFKQQKPILNPAVRRCNPREPQAIDGLNLAAVPNSDLD